MKILFIFFLFPILIFAELGFHEPWGKDSNLKYKPKSEPAKKHSILTKVANSIIVFHQKVLSPVDGPRSHFRPTSSRYMQLAIKRFGFFKGFVMGCDRLLRENDDPWVYQKITFDNIDYKFDPATPDKFIR